MNYKPLAQVKVKIFIEKEEVLKDSASVLNYFLENPRDILYVCEGNSLHGIITLGDYKRNFGEPNKMINTSFRYVMLDNLEQGRKLFLQYPYIHEIPVVEIDSLTGEKFLKGILVDEFEYDTLAFEKRKKYFMTIKARRYEYQIFEKFCEKCPAQVFLYNVPLLAEIMAYIDSSILRHDSSTYHSAIEYLEHLSEEQQQDFFGMEYSTQSLSRIKKEITSYSIDIINGIPRIKDLNGKFFNFQHGYRVETTRGSQKEKANKIWFFGPCITAGAYVPTEHTITTFFRQRLEMSEQKNCWSVVNCGICDTSNLIGRVQAETITENDIVVIINDWNDFASTGILKKYYKGSLSKAYVGVEDPCACSLDTPTHCNGTINKNIANIIWNDLLEEKVFENHHYNPNPKILPAKDYYIGYNIIESVETTMKSYKVDVDGNARVGAIVMNCNPFTKGHRYLVEHALKQVDLLYVFVVEEDKSVFKFQDRFRMVQEGLKDLENIVVLPSGKYIISKETFSQYFTKDQVQEVQSMDYDVRIFGEVVAPFLNITCRFVGQEPFDRVTNTYNETMKRILPEYGIDLIEIERVSNEIGQIISATMVRKLLEENRWDELRNFVPESTISILRK